MEKLISNDFRKTLVCMMHEINGHDYNANSAVKALAKETKHYLLDVLNFENKGKYLHDPIFASFNFSFHGHHLSWNSRTWLKSALVLYYYFEAKTLISAIKEYEQIFRCPIVDDYNALLESIYQYLHNGKEINFYKVKGLNANFDLVPLEVLENKVKRFEELYE